MTKRKGQHMASPKDKTQRHFKSLPASLEGRTELALQRITRPTCKRVLEYIVAHPDTWTHHIARECACINVPDIVMHMRGNLAQVGVKLHCYLPPKEKRLQTRFGEESAVHKWRPILLDGGEL